jgi:hypothetical protein
MARKRKPSIPYVMPDEVRVRLECFGRVRRCSDWHWQIRDEDGCLLADWWPHTRKFQVENEPTACVGHDDDSHVEAFIAALLYEFPEFAEGGDQ